MPDLIFAGRKTGFPFEYKGKICLRTEAEFFGNFSYTHILVDHMSCGIDFHHKKIFMNAYAGIFCENSFQSCLADIAAFGNFFDSGHGIYIAAHIIYGVGENFCVPCLGGVRYRTVDAQRQKQLINI